MPKTVMPEERSAVGSVPLRLVAEGGASDGDAGELPKPRGVRFGTLLWSEWFSHSKLLLVFLLSWLVVFWAVPLIVHPLWVLAFGVIYALVAGPAMGGSDVIHGCEEFMLSLPPTRRQRLRARWVLGLGGLLLFTVLDLAALGLNLSDVLARLFLSTGLMQPVQLNQPGLMYGLVIAFPGAIFAFGFAMASIARSRTVAMTSWLWGSLFALGTLRLGLELEEARWDEFNGRFVTPLLLAVSIAVLVLVDYMYGWKEAGAEAPPLRIPLSLWGWILALLFAAIGVGALLTWFASNFGRLL